MQSLEAKINILEKFISEIQTMNTALLENEPTTELFQTNLSEIVNQFEALDSDSDYESDTDSDISFTEEEREELTEDLDIDFLDDDWTCSDDTSFELLCGCDLEDPVT